MTIIIIAALLVLILVAGQISRVEAKVSVFAPGGILLNEFDALIDKWAGIRANLAPAEIKASIQTESSGNPIATNPGDPSWGLMGITRLIARAYLGSRANDDRWHQDPELNIEAGSGFLSDLKRKYAADYSDWIQAYNVGETKFLRGIRNPEYQATWEKWLGVFSA